MKAVKAKYENGGETDPPEKAMYSDEEDGGQAHRAKARAALKKQMKDMAIERDSTMRGTVKGGTMFAEANPDFKGSQSLTPRSQAKVKNFYDKKIAKFQKELAKYQDPKEEKVKMFDRQDTMDLVRGMVPLAAQTKDSTIRRG
tara:strand:- start:85 stop:513 length:429 start_codon:yes stop_codon:yes gene_type:complete